MIPKIIHHTGPSNKDNWHPLWFKCRESWLKCFPNHEHRFWNDEDIDNLVYNNYPQYWEMYNSFPVHIMKIDFIRFCFMDKFGGIYADLDYYCYKNFEHVLVNDSYVVENPFGNDPIENSLMASVPNSFFFKQCSSYDSRWHGPCSYRGCCHVFCYGPKVNFFNRKMVPYDLSLYIA